MTLDGFILEHPTRGVLMFVDHDGRRWIPHFSWSKPRSEAQVYHTIGAAQADRAKLAEGQLRDRTVILRRSNWEEV